VSRAPAPDGVRLSELATLVDGRVIGDANKRVRRVRDAESAEPGDVTFIGHAKHLAYVRATRATAFLTDTRTAAHIAHELPCAVLAVDEPARALVRVIERLMPERAESAFVDTRAHVHLDARIAEGVSIGPGAVVGRAVLGQGVTVGPLAFVDDDVVVEAGAHIGPGVVVLRGSTIGARAILQPGVVVGADGFGYAPDGDRNIKVAQLGVARVERDVEIGANSCVDRGALRDTVVGEGTKVDNLVQIAHGARIGAHAVVVAQSGIAGDADVGARAVLAGQVGVVPYARIGEGARIGAQSGVTHDVAAGSAVSGTPAVAHTAWLKASVRYRSLDDTVRRLRAAERTIAALSERIARLERDTGTRSEDTH